MKISFVLPLAVLCLPSWAQIKATQAACQPGGSTCEGKFDSGLVYTLPRTAIAVAAPVIKNTYTPGVYCQVANVFFPLAAPKPTCNPETPESVRAHCKKDKKNNDGVVEANGFIGAFCYDYTFTNTPALSVIGRPDPAEVYELDLSGWGRDREINLNLGQDGIVNKVHAAVVDRRAEIIFGFLNAAASITKGAFAGMKAMPADQKSDICTTSNDAKLCEAAKSDFETLQGLLNDNSIFSATGNFPSNSDAYLALLKARQERVTQILSKFFGVKESNTDYDGSIEVMPLGTKLPDKGIDIVLFSVGQQGACGAGSDGPSQYTLRFLSAKPSAPCPQDVTQIKLTLRSRNPSGEMSISTVVQQSTKKNTKDLGLAYRIPAPVTGAIFAGADESMEQDISIGQYGAVVRLPANIGGDATMDFTLDPATGALLQISLNGKAKILGDLPGQLSTLGGGALDALTAYNAAHKDTASPDPLDQATNARRLAQEQLRLLLIQQCVANPDRPECPTLVGQQ